MRRPKLSAGVHESPANLPEVPTQTHQPGFDEMKQSINRLTARFVGTLCVAAFVCSSLSATVAQAGEGPGRLHLPAKGKSQGKIVLVAGDEEYRTEESMPMLGKILSQKHGFDCTVIFSMSADGKYIDPNNQEGIVAWDELDDADLMLIGTRFRRPNEEDSKHITSFINAGKPVIGIRTATHAFTGGGKFGGTLGHGQFGRQILGEQWVAHHGGHKRQGARGVVVEDQASHPILNSVSDVFAPSDVYTVRNLTDKDEVLLLGAVTETLDPKSKIIDDKKNDPLQALAWIHPYTAPNGTEGKSFCTTAGASVDLVSEDLRRMLVNATYYLLDKDVPAKADVAFVDAFYPTFYGFIREKDHYKNLDMQPEKYGLGKTPSSDDPPGTPEWNFRARP